MTSSGPPENELTDNEQSLASLVRFIDLSKDRFALSLVRCNYRTLRDLFLQQLRDEYSVDMTVLVVPRSARLLYTVIKTELESVPPHSVLMVVGLEVVDEIDDLLAAANNVRNEFQNSFPFPIVLWVNDEIQRKLARCAPDFNSWCGVPTNLEATTTQLMALLEEGINEAFAKQLKLLGAEPEWIQQAIRDHKIELTEALQAGLDFLLGYDARIENRIDAALTHYQSSLAYWQRVDQPLKEGLTWQEIATARELLAQQQKHSSEVQSSQLQATGDALQEAIRCFEQVQRFDLKAEAYSAWGKVLQHLSDWHGLKVLAQQAIPLHQDYGSPEQLAQDYLFLTEVALQEKNYAEAKTLAQKALDQMPEPSHLRGVCYARLALAQQYSGQIQAAIASFKQAKVETKAQLDPAVYIQLLNQASQLYFAQGEYLDAFRLKQERRSVEQQYGFRAFIGAGRLQPLRQIQSAAEANDKEEIAREITASGRQIDVERLVAKLSEKRFKLIVLHGPSGVGKSSIISAGLVPLLKQEEVGTLEILPVYVRAYSDWKQELAKALKVTHNTDAVFSLQDFMTWLREKKKHSQLPVLIFDQFEEFFFVCSKPEERQEFWELLRICIEGKQVESVKVVLSLREDYLHYLLELERLGSSNPEMVTSDALKDILNQQQRYSLGNLSRTNAKEVIHRLTQDTQLTLEPNLVARLIEDLSKEIGEVRPIELQVVGAQLQTENITTLEEYLQLGDNPKKALVQKYLEAVLHDCGAENEKVARLVLYLLTDENNTRPPKTKADLASQLETEADKLDVVLEILVDSGLVFLLPEFPVDRYQLVHDYLVTLIRQQQEPELLADLKLEREQRRQAEEQLRQSKRKERKQLLSIVVGIILVAISVSIAVILNKTLREQKVTTDVQKLSLSSNILELSGLQIEALIKALNANLLVEQNSDKVNDDTKTQVAFTLRQSMGRISEHNRLISHQGAVWDVQFSPDGHMLASVSADKTVRLWNRDGKAINHPFEGKEIHTDTILAVRFSPDSKILASASFDGTIELWKRDGTPIKTLNVSQRPIRDVQFSPDGQILASASDDGTIELWKRDGTPIKTLNVSQTTSWSVAFSPDGQTLASASDDNTVKLWKRDGTPIKTLMGHGGPVLSARFSPDGKILASASFDKTVRLWNSDGTPIATLEGHTGPILAVQFSPDGKILASAGFDKTVRLWNSDGTPIATLEGHQNFVRDVQFSPDGQTLASASDDNTVRLWNLLARTPITTLKGHQKLVRVVRFSPDGQTIASASFDGTVKLWQKNGESWARDGGQIAKLAWPTSEYKGQVMLSAQFSPDGQLLASPSADGSVWLGKRDGKRIKMLVGHKFPVLATQFSPDSQILALASSDKTVSLWKRDGTLINTLKGHTAPVGGVSFSPDSKVLASASFDSTVRLWKRDGTPLINAPLEGHTQRVRAVQFSPDGQVLASASDDKTVILWKRDGTRLKILEGHKAAITIIRFSPDSKVLASASDDSTVMLWKRDGTPLKTLKGHQKAVTTIRFSPDGKILASASEDNTIKLWGLDGILITTLEGHASPILAVQFSPDGKILASASEDNTIKLWGLDGILITTLEGHKGSVKAVQFDPNNQALRSVGFDKTIRVWDFSLGNLTKTACDWLKDYILSRPTEQKLDICPTDTKKLPI